MTPRPREVLEKELAHVHFLLDELQHWDSTYVPKGARNYLTQRYERQVRILLSVLAEAPGASAAASVSAPAPAPVQAGGVGEAGAAQEVVSAPEVVNAAPAAEPVPPSAVSQVAEAQTQVDPHPNPLPEGEGVDSGATREARYPHPDPLPKGEGEAGGEGVEAQLPPVVTEPLFDPPPVRSVTARIVEEASTWDTVWRPFLYESIGWFIGAFLIVAGSLYLAFDSWAGLTSFSRSLVVFGMTAGYSAAFSICGALLARREALSSAGRILGLIGAAVAPLAGVALGPLDSLSLDGVPLALLLPLLLGWSVGAAALVRKPAESFDAPSRPLVQLALLGSTLMMGLAPLFARVGALAFWLDVMPCVLFFVLSRRPVPEPRSSKALAFVLAAPFYLLLLYAIRLHLALAAAGVPPAFGSYAPFLAFLFATCLGFRRLPPHEAADSLSVSIASLQVGCLALAATGSPPAFFLTAAVFTWTVFGLSRGELPRVRWVYLAYAGAYFSYASAGQLVPGAVQALLDSLKAALGYPVAGKLPFHYGALSAVPFVLAGAILAGWLRFRSERTSSARDAECSEVLLRATAIASPLFVLLGHLGPDQRPAFWTALGLIVVCVASGLFLERLYLSIVGAALSFLLSISAYALFGAAGASLICGGVALAFAALSLVCTRRTCLAFSGAVAWLSFIGFVFALGAGASASALIGMVLGGIAALLVAWNLANPYLLAVAAFGAAAVVPKLASLVDPSWVPLALAVSALGLAALGGLGGRARLLGWSGVTYALLAFLWGISIQVPWFGFTVLLAAAAVAVASRVSPEVRPLAVVLAGFALLPRVGNISAWPWMTPALSVALFVPWALGASVAAARWGRSASTLTAGIVALIYPVFAVSAAHGEQPYPLVLAVALAALLTARALHPSVSVVVSSLWAAVYVFQSTHAPQALALATLLSLLALLESHRAAFRVLAGERRFALAATLCALCFLLFACVDAHGGESLAVLAGAVLLPLVWTRANRQPFFAGLAPLFSLFLVLETDLPMPWAVSLPLLALAVVRAAEHLPAVRHLLLGTSEEKTVRQLSLWMQAALMLVGVVLVPETNAEPWVLAPLAASLVLLPGPRPSVRVGLGVSLLLFCFPLHLGGIVLLLALGFLTHHTPGALWAFFRSPPDASLRPVTVVGALALCGWSLLLQAPTPAAIALLAGVLLVGTFLLSQRWMLTASVLVFAGASLGKTAEHGFLEWRPEAALAFAAVALGAALLSALCQLGGIQRALTRLAERLSPGLPDTWSEPLWMAGALTAAVPVVVHLVDRGPGALPLPVALLAGLASLVLMVSREREMANVAAGLLAGVLVAAVPPLWAPAVVSVTGLVLCMAGTWLDERDVAVGAALHHAGWVLSLLSLFGLRDLKHPGTAVCFLSGITTAWAVVYRRPERAVVGWVASLVGLHALLAHVGALFSTGKGAEFILPFFGAVSALLATAALFLASERIRRGVGHSFAVVAMVEVLGGLVLVPGAAGVVVAALVDCVCLAVLFFALVRRAVREKDEGSAFLAVGTVVLGYLSVRLHALASGLGTTDSLAALVGGAIFSGLYVFAMREGSGLPVFRRPALWGAFLFPLAGLFTAPWNQPLYVAALLVGYAAHFAALAAHPSQRGMASLVSVGAFNSALFFVWLGTGAGEPQYYVIPAGLSLLVLLRVFQEALEPDTRAKLRAMAITLVYVAGAWKPLMFQDGRSMLLCVLLCVVGVAAGMALRIRSYVYLGSAFLVTCVLANLARFGIRDHRMGAAFLSLLGVGVVGFMVLFTAKRAELLERYERVRAMMNTWEG
ncbi:hypothetical protein [Archangium lansingense]|uniref:DUF2157 domain-containing protein n=1 Tax=Archangium lansingense TaxID=2995310 RepID=A0ABT4AJJ8_9BACT|nr:hypothetical protein [Archangium lansinium]MCY1081868.1 hypothetical protein [Archangium lansinium]